MDDNDAQNPACGWAQHHDERRRAWLRLSLQARLRWLEQAKRFSQSALGAARKSPRRAMAGSPAGTEKSEPTADR